VGHFAPDKAKKLKFIHFGGFLIPTVDYTFVFFVLFVVKYLYLATREQQGATREQVGGKTQATRRASASAQSRYSQLSFSCYCEVIPL
jgi:predicted ABC-type sugar transport system permease subunit